MNNMPMEFAFQLSMNEQAMENFAHMTEEEKRQVLAERNVTFKEQMRGIMSDMVRIAKDVYRQSISSHGDHFLTERSVIN